MGRYTILAVLAVVVTLSGCLSSETTVEINRDGSGRVTLEYIVDAVAWQTGAVGGEAAGRIVPITRTEFERSASQLEGLRLRRYRSRDREETVEVTAILDFDSVGVLERFLGPDSVEIEIDDAGGRWTQQLAEGRVVDENDVSLARSLEQYSLSIRLQPPSRVRQVSDGEITPDGRVAGIEIGFDEIVLADQPIVWTVEW